MLGEAGAAPDPVEEPEEVPEDCPGDIDIVDMVDNVDIVDIHLWRRMARTCLRRRRTTRWATSPSC